MALAAVLQTSNAQMVPGSRAIAETTELGLDRTRKSRDFTMQQLSCSVPANVLWPGDQAKLTFRVTNTSSAPISGKGTIKVLHYGTRGKPGDIWEPEFFVNREVGSIPFQFPELAAGASTQISIEPKIPETFGGYLLVAELDGHGRAFAASLVRSIQPDGGAVQYPAYALDLEGTSEEVARFFKRVGVKGARAEFNVFGKNDPDYAKKWDRIAKLCRTLEENEITLMVTTASGPLPMPLGMARPHLDDEDTFKATKSDLAWLPSADKEFGDWVMDLCGAYGWPYGPIHAFELWNEPWEGISISGWGADMLRYREIYKTMAQTIEAARKEYGVDVLIGGCGSSSNTLDKLFPDGSNEFLKWLDFCSIHYQIMAATPALMRNFIGRPNGPVRVWDTESWIANSEDRVGLVVASMHAMGQERAMGVYAGNVYQPQTVTLDGGKQETVVQAWSPAAAVGASTKFVGQRPFRELLFQNGLPWIFVFDGRPGQSPDDGTVVITGDLGGCYSRNLLLFRTVLGLENQPRVAELRKQLDKLPADAPEAARKELTARIEAASVLENGSLTISDGGGRFQLMDFYGNPVPAQNGKIVVPLNGYGYYLRANGESGSFSKLLDELRNARIAGYEPVEIIPHDLTASLDKKPELRLSVTNVLNRPISGTLSVRLNGTEIPGPKAALQLAAHETREVKLDVEGVPAAANNSYRCEATFDAGEDGTAAHSEAIRANVISRRTVTVDGKLDDWAGAIPQPLAAAGIGANLTEKAWLPFSTFDEKTMGGLVAGYTAYDDKYFYFAARIADSTPDPGMVRFETRDDDKYFYPEVSWRLDEKGTFVKEDKPIGNPEVKASLRDEKQRLQLPAGEGRSSTDWESLSVSLAFDLDLPATEARQVALYFLSWDPLGRHNVKIEISDAATGKVLNRQTLKDFHDGKYVLYDLAGNLRITVTSNNWLRGILNGVFFDPAKKVPAKGGAMAEFVSIDDRTGGDWKGIYGSKGYVIAGVEPNVPKDARFAFSTEIKKQELRWPEGVRRFSYRMRPDLPAGGPTPHDNVQIAFNVLPDDQKPWLPSPPGTPSRWMMYWDTDYEYALNEVAEEFGGGNEIWRLQVPGMPRKHFYPRQPKSPFDGPVKDGKLVTRRDGNTRIVEAALPWTEIPEVKKRLDAGEPIKFTFRVNDNAGLSYELATDRSVSKANSTTFHSDWQTHWSNELEFGFEK
jgi:hypothetical protein